jgi:hypothetical protein
VIAPFKYQPLKQTWFFNFPKILALTYENWFCIQLRQSVCNMDDRHVKRVSSSNWPSTPFTITFTCKKPPQQPLSSFLPRSRQNTSLVKWLFVLLISEYLYYAVTRFCCCSILFLTPSLCLLHLVSWKHRLELVSLLFRTRLSLRRQNTDPLRFSQFHC